MVFNKSFPKTKDKYPVWVEVRLTEEEEKEVEEQARLHNLKLMKQCIENAKSLNEEIDISRIAVALFEKLASHSVYWKESKCRDKFEKSRD